MVRKLVTEPGFYGDQFMKPGQHYEDGADAVDIEKLSKDDLVVLAAERGIEVKPADTKADIIAAINAQA